MPVGAARSHRTGIDGLEHGRLADSGNGVRGRRGSEFLRRAWAINVRADMRNLDSSGDPRTSQMEQWVRNRRTHTAKWPRLRLVRKPRFLVASDDGHTESTHSGKPASAAGEVEPQITDTLRRDEPRR